MTVRFWQESAAWLICGRMDASDPKATLRYPSMKAFSTAIMCCMFLIASPSNADGPDDETTTASFEFAFMIFEEFRITPEIGVVYQPIFPERFGHLERTSTEEGYDDPTYKQIWETLYYDGIEITISRGAEDPPSGWTWLDRVRITNPKYALRHNLRIGDPVKKFEETLGPWRGKRSTDSTSISFYAGGYGEPGGVTHGAHATVTLELDSDGIVTAVDIKYWSE